MRTIAILNQKGGCGKTTCSINLAAVLASRGHKTVLVDMDPQSHCALGLAVPESQVDQSMADMLRAGLNGSIAFADIVWQISRKLDLAPSSMALAGIEQELANAPDRDRRLLQVLSTVADRYDYCIIDCPPSIGLLTFNAMRAADEVIIPVETGYFALQGSVKQKATIEMLARRAGHQVRFSVLATMYDVRTKLAREILAELKRNFGDHLLPIVVHFNSKLKEAASFGQPIVEYDPASRGMQDFEALATWLRDNPPRASAAPPAISEGDARENPMPKRPAPAEPMHAAPSNPSMTRAAELVERARALSERTTALTARLQREFPSTRPTGDDSQAPAPTPPTRSPATAPIPGGPSQPAAEYAGGNGNGTLTLERDEDETANDSARNDPNLREKLARMHGVRQTAQGTLFVQPVTDAKQVQLAGDFNNWSKTATPMTLNRELGVLEACVAIPPGRYQYRLIVDGQWVQDPFNSYVEANPQGQLNSIVEVH